MTERTKGLLVVDDGMLFEAGERGAKVANCEGWRDPHQSIGELRGNAKHLAACWNAFEGSDIPTSAIREGMVREMMHLLGFMAFAGPYSGRPTEAELSQQARALLASLKPEKSDAD